MRLCLSFLVVEYMRQGVAVGEACQRSITRLKELIPLHNIDAKGDITGKTCTNALLGVHGDVGDSNDANTLDTMHTTLVVGVVAMDPQGNVGAASTLDATNLHRGEPFFPVVCWRADDNDEKALISAIGEENDAPHEGGKEVPAATSKRHFYRLGGSTEGAQYSI
mmetsp:Transcript_12081/g.20179  ORF Transcript_12081/g.20179 Transcript_12081/m.20179 type:complete len:165 (+) Transcript_12081:1066-1560(+)